MGARVLDALLDLKFNVTVLSRRSTNFPTGARVKVVDFTSVDALSAAIAGQDAVIDTTFSPEVDTPLRLIEAAAKAGVYRLFVSPSNCEHEIFGLILCFCTSSVSRVTLGSTLNYRAFATCLFSAERRFLMMP